MTEEDRQLGLLITTLLLALVPAAAIWLAAFIHAQMTAARILRNTRSRNDR
ncbi:MAG: hypothetical protein WCP82_05005 [Alphaproteobacteria bacterium]